MTQTGSISENSRRIAKNTVLLYFRMLLLMVIGLYASRVVLRVLGIDDFGVYNAVGDVVTGFTFITASLSAAITRYMASGLGGGDAGRMKRVFSTSVLVQLAFAVLMIILVETVGNALLHTRMDIPEGRMGAAGWVLQCSLGVLVLNLLSVPYNATIIAHEKMGAFAAISFLEGCLQLGVALLLSLSGADKLVTYAVLMLAVALVVRLSYGLYCRRHFEESRGRLVFDPSLLKEMTSFAGWNFFGSSAYVFNTRVVNVVVNIFFGVAMNAARAVALKVEGTLKQFVSNFLTALNPQITKSWASGDREYCFELVRKGAKYTFWMLLLMFIPVFIWTRPLLVFWLGADRVQDITPLFTRLALVALMVDMVGNTLVTLVQATGEVRRYYLVTGLVSYLCLPLVWLSFRLGAPVHWAYICFIAVYLVVFVLRLILVHDQTGFPVGRFLRGFFTITKGEREFVFRKVSKFLPDSLFLRWKYRLIFGRRPDLSHPKRFTEQMLYLKLNDRRPEYHDMADKIAVKKIVTEKIGGEHVIPTLGVWDRVEDISWDSLPEDFVIKCSHDSGSTVVCHPGYDREAVKASLSKAMGTDFYRRDREWTYKGLRPRIIAEEFIGESPVDYKFFCFDGRPEFMFTATGRGSGEEVRFDFFDMEWNHLDVRNGHPNASEIPAKPECFEQMKELAARLSEGIPHVRIDFYEVGGKVLFGEYTFYHFGGFVPFEPDSFDMQFGKYLKF